MVSDLAIRVFTSDEWRRTVAAVQTAFGVDVAIIDADGSATIHTGERPSACGVLDPDVPGPTAGCPAVIHASDGLMCGPCAAGLTCVLAPVHGGSPRPEAFILLGGFLKRRGDRAEIARRLVAKGLPEREASACARDIPILSSARLSAMRDIAVTAANGLLEAEHLRAEGEQDRRAAMLVGELCVDVEAHSRDIGEVRALVLERAMGLVGAEVGSLLVHRVPTDLLEIAVVCGDDPKAVGGCCRVGEGLAGQAAATRRSIVVSGESVEHAMPGVYVTTGSWMSIPMSAEGSLVAVANLGRLPGRPPMTTKDLRSAEEYLSSAASALTSSMSFTKLREEIAELQQIDAVAVALENGVDLEEDLALLASIASKTFDPDVVGLFFAGYGKPRMFATLRSDVSAEDLARLLSEATGEPDIELPCDLVLDTVQVSGAVDSAEADWSVIAVDVRFQDRAAGCLFVASATPGRFSARDERLLARIATHASPTIERAALLARLRDDLAKMLTALSATIDAKERREHGRDRTMDYAIAIAERMGLAVEDVERLRFAGLLHDIGKVGIAEEILLKPSALTAEELEHVRRHAEIGASIVEQLTFLHEVAPIILHHHERWDGAGYPMGLAGDAIPLLARVLAVADSYQAMTSPRAYRPSLGVAQAREELRRGAGTQFDPDVVGAFLQLLDERAVAGATGLFADHFGDEPRLPA